MRNRKLDMGWVSAVLEREYGSPRHGNKRNPLDELIYIILSTRTREPVFVSSFKKLKARFASWDKIRSHHTRVITHLLHANGLAFVKAQQIVGIVKKLRRKFGRATLAPLKYMSDDDAERFLVTLPGVSRKVAKCVMMYSLDRDVLPVDVHVHRITGRLGLKVKRRPDTSQDFIEHAIPESKRYSFHVNAVAHGRKLCLANEPKCSVCPIKAACQFGKRVKAKEKSREIAR